MERKVDKKHHRHHSGGSEMRREGEKSPTQSPPVSPTRVGAGPTFVPQVQHSQKQQKKHKKI